MQDVLQLTFNELCHQEPVYLPHHGHLKIHRFFDVNGSTITCLSVCNGVMTFTVLVERGMDIGDIYDGEQKVSWERDSKYLLHPENVNLNANNGTEWVKGFYPAVASIGPELFGTPGEGYTLHGTGSYSPADRDSLLIYYDEKEISVQGIVPVKGYGDNPIFEKKIKISSQYDSSLILREETTKNLTNLPVVLDDGLHIQLSGHYLWKGGRYVLPVKTRYLLLRDSAPVEADPLYINPASKGKQPLRCYQYVPEPVFGLVDIADIKDYLPGFQNKCGITAEIIVNDTEDTAAYVIRPLDCFPKSLVAKENASASGGSFMFSFEPCRTRPNRISQKITDGEAYYLEPKDEAKTLCLIGITKNPESIKTLETIIKKAVGL